MDTERVLLPSRPLLEWRVRSTVTLLWRIWRLPRGGGKKITACLVYPCRVDTWRSLQERGRLVHRATVGSGARPVDVVLTAVPMGVSMGEAMMGLRV